MDDSLHPNQTDRVKKKKNVRFPEEGLTQCSKPPEHYEPDPEWIKKCKQFELNRRDEQRRALIRMRSRGVHREYFSDWIDYTTDEEKEREKENEQQGPTDYSIFRENRKYRRDDDDDDNSSFPAPPPMRRAGIRI